MTAWVFEAHHCPTLLNEIKKTKLQIYTSPQAGINILLAAVNVCVYAVWGIGGLKNEAQRNVKPDLLRTVPRDQTTF
jgi:hypothetical protein